MWARIKRIFRSIIGYFIELGESPELILEQNIRDMQDQIPAMNENLALMRAQVTLSDKSRNELRCKEQDLTNKIKAALQVNKRDIALNFATTLEEVRGELQNVNRQHELVQQAFEKAEKVKKTFLSQIQQKTDAARKALSNKRAAEWQGKVADAMASFQVAGIDASHDEMIRKMDEEAAVSAGKLEAAMSNLPDIDIEKEAQNIQANETLRQFELNMGLADISEPPTPPQRNVEEEDMLERVRNS